MNKLSRIINDARRAFEGTAKSEERECAQLSESQSALLNNARGLARSLPMSQWVRIPGERGLSFELVDNDTKITVSAPYYLERSADILITQGGNEILKMTDSVIAGEMLMTLGGRFELESVKMPPPAGEKPARSHRLTRLFELD